MTDTSHIQHVEMVFRISRLHLQTLSNPHQPLSIQPSAVIRNDPFDIFEIALNRPCLT